MRRPIKNVSLLMIVFLLFGIFSVSAEESQVVESIKISLAFDTMKVGETQKVRVSISPSNAENYELEYSSSNPDVITAATLIHFLII